MFTGVSFEQAVKYYMAGREVIVIDRNSKGRNGKGYDTFLFEELFNNVELLADVPAVENPEWKAAVLEMEQAGSASNQVVPEDEVPSLQEEEPTEGVNEEIDKPDNLTKPEPCGGG